MGIFLVEGEEEVLSNLHSFANQLFVVVVEGRHRVLFQLQIIDTLEGAKGLEGSLAVNDRFNDVQ